MWITTFVLSIITWVLFLCLFFVLLGDCYITNIFKHIHTFENKDILYCSYTHYTDVNIVIVRGIFKCDNCNKMFIVYGNLKEDKIYWDFNNITKCSKKSYNEECKR